MSEDRRIGQSVCAKCGKTVHPGSGRVLHYGKSGRVHRLECTPDHPASVLANENTSKREITRKRS